MPAHIISFLSAPKFTKLYVFPRLYSQTLDKSKVAFQLHFTQVIEAKPRSMRGETRRSLSPMAQGNVCNKFILLAADPI